MKPSTKYILLLILLIQGILVSAMGPGSLIWDGVIAGITGQEVERDHFSSGGDAMVQDLTLRDLISNFTTVPKGEWVRSSEDPGGPCTAKLLEQLAKDIKDYPELDVWLKRTPGGVKAWEIAIKYSKVRTSVSALTKIDNILSNGRIPAEKLKAAIDGNLGDILNVEDAINLEKILDRLNIQHVIEAHFDKILQRLSNYPTLKQDFVTNPQWFETFDDILKEPGKYWDILNEGNLPSGSALAQWGQGFWWKNLRELADQFEGGSALTSFISTHNLNINQVVTEVTLEVNGIRIRIDYLGKDAAGKFYFGDTKFSTKTKNWISEWHNAATDNQPQVIPLFQSGGVNSIVVKANDSQKLMELVNIGLANNSSISFANTPLKIFESEANQQVVKTVFTLKS